MTTPTPDRPWTLTVSRALPAPTLADLERLVTTGEEETLELEFKGAAALDFSDPRRKAELRKDVSAMANAAGGRIIYGIAEERRGPNRSRAARLDPVVPGQIDKETIAQIISRIRPRLDGVRITAVRVDDAGQCFVLDVPQGRTAHQADDLVYYRRNNTITEAMHDHEIRDVLARGDQPRLVVGLSIRVRSQLVGHHPGTGDSQFTDRYTMEVGVQNTGARYAQFVNGWITIPSKLRQQMNAVRIRPTMLVPEQLTFDFDNRTHDMIGAPGSPMKGPSYYAPILPGLSQRVCEVDLDGSEYNDLLPSAQIGWAVYADNAGPMVGTIPLASVVLHDERRTDT